MVQNTAAAVGTWDTGAGSDNVFYTDRISYAGGKAARHPFSSHWNSSLWKNGTFPVLYIDFKRYYPGSNGDPSNYKPWRIYGNNDQMQLVMGFGCGYQVVTMETDSGGGTNWSADSLDGRMDAWQHYQIIYRESSVGVADGTIITLLDGQVDGWNDTAVQTRGSDVHLDQIRIGHYFDIGPRESCDPSDSSVVYTDNVYLDTTWSRVELGNASTYATSTHREIQIPTAWANDGTSITINVNIGTFTAGQTAYLYVFNEGGEVNGSGRAVVIGGGAPAAAPAAPAGLVVQ